MSKKAIIIGIITVLVVAVGTTAVLYFIKNNTSSNNPSTPVAETVPDLSANYGACDLVTKDLIQSNLDIASVSLFDGFDTGKGNLGGGDTAQDCVFGFNKQVTEISPDMFTNSFYTTVHVFADQAQKTAGDSVYEGADIIPGIGDKAAFFEESGEALDYTNFEVRVSKGLRVFSFSIRQSKDSTLFTSVTAKSKLAELAKTVDYTKFETTK